MEIERKWMVNGWPSGLKEIEIWNMDQGYISLHPTVRIRREELVGVKTEHVLCFKGASSNGGMAREEIETVIDEELFNKLSAFIGKPLIIKEKRVYELKAGLKLEVNIVDKDTDNEFSYAEVEFDSIEEAKRWKPDEDGLSEYLSDECTGVPGSSMGAFWEQTRGV